MSKTLKSAALQSVAIWIAPQIARAARRAVRALAPSRAPLSPIHRKRQLLVDVSIIAAHDAGTGIQRVVRSLLIQLLQSPPDGFIVRPICATRKSSYRYTDSFLSEQASMPNHCPLDTANNPAITTVRVEPGDIFVGLDLTSRIIPRRQRDLLSWKRQGVQCAFVVYDLLPFQHPYWFTPRARRSFKHWLSTLAVHADALWCISRTVARDTRELMQRRFGLTADDTTICSFDLGTNALDRLSAPPSFTPVSSCRRHKRPMLLMVGTIEPRKGHMQVLNAFDALWRNGTEVDLVIVGAPGWHVELVVNQLTQHPQNEQRLFWLRDADDAQLEALYARADGLVMASEAEGFGLPIIEAARHGKPLFLRDLDVFREVAREHATYFRATTGEELALQLSNWLAQLAAGTAPTSEAIKPVTWATSAAQLKALIATLACAA
ncbi:TPA: glycosyltransferase family 4 protein [Burkholderia contaminans]|nr:glycosyltransferase family 4 protein [Burkholderia contaminans]